MKEVTYFSIEEKMRERLEFADELRSFGNFFFFLGCIAGIAAILAAASAFVFWSKHLLHLALIGGIEWLVMFLLVGWLYFEHDRTKDTYFILKFIENKKAKNNGM
jgi:hypothetical protein